MRRHVSWITLLLLVPGTYLLAGYLTGWLRLQASAAESGDLGLSVSLSLLSLFAAGVALVGPVVFLVLAIVHIARVYRRWQRRRGRYTALERRHLRSQDDAARAWEHTRALRAWLIQRRVPATLQQWDVVPMAGEVFFSRLTLQYARYYGQDVTYSRRGGFFFGHPAFVVGALALTAVANSAAKSSARAQAAEQWREVQNTIVYVSNQRLVVRVSGTWLTFSYSTMSAVFPEVSAQTLVCQFHNSAPLLLAGADAPIAAVYTILQTYGPQALAEHPSLRPLDRPAPAASLPAVGRERARGAT